MRLDLSDEEAATLRDLLRDYLPALRREVAATDGHDLRQLLAKRRDLAEKLLGMLERSAA